MKKGPFKIYITHLKDDDTEQIFEIVESDFLELKEQELSFIEKITVSGQAYLAKNHLVLDLKIKAKALIPCSICNETIEVPLEIDNFTHTVELCEVKSAFYDFSEEIRHNILLKIPHFVECNKGHCPQRNTVNKYLKDTTEDTSTPFSELSL